MEARASDWRPGPTVCRCCLTEGCYKDISTEYFWMGKREVYAEMLSETLNVSIAYSKSGGPNSNSRLICEPCIARLRDASEFKRQVIDCEKTFMHHLDPGSSSRSRDFTSDSGTEVKVELVKREKESLSDDDFDDRPDFLDVDTDDDLDDQPLTKLATKIPKKESVDLLELLDSSQITVKRKSTLKLKEAPPKKIMKKKEAASKASVSKAVSIPVKQADKKKAREMAKRNAEVVLQYSTLYPFRAKGLTLVCVYCCDQIEDPDEYRCHMDTMHHSVNINTAFAHTKRRHDHLKVDCVNLKCRLCQEHFDTIAEVAQHLTDQHKNKDINDLNLNYEVGLHPYRLIKDKLVCLVCNVKLPTLTKLTRHMSSHYAEYSCELCDKSYLNEDNLRSHIRYSHSEKHICRKCMMMFSTLEEKKEHLKISTQCWGTMCSHCGERFPSWDQKQKHLVSEHNITPIMYTCPDCEAVFKSRYNFYHHYNTSHSESALMCSYCGNKFKSQSVLDDHLIVHIGVKQFNCTVCSKAFSRLKALEDHMWTHSAITKFQCRICDKSFCKRVSLNSHMRNVHFLK